MRMWLGGFSMAMVAATLLATSTASAQRRRTAIVNLASDQNAGALTAKNLRAELQKRPDLRPLPAGAVARGLEEPLPTEGPEVAAFARARKLLAKAKTDLGSFRQSAALKAVAEAEKVLLTVAPQAEQKTLLADLAFFAGRVHLREQNRGLARSSFELALRMNPEMPSPDPGRFNPDIVSTFAEARNNRKRGGGGTLELSATYDGVEIFLDGVSVGTTPLALSVSAGSHYIAAISSEHRIAAQRVDVGDGDSVEIEIELVALPARDVAQRLRQAALSQKVAVGGPRLTALAKSVLALTGEDSVLIVRGTFGNLEVAAYRRDDDGLTRFLSADSGTESLMGLLSPVRTLRPDQLFTDKPGSTNIFLQRDFLEIAIPVTIGVVAAGILVGIAASDDSPGEITAVFGGFE